MTYAETIEATAEELAAAQDVIERTKACKPECEECARIFYDCVFKVASGSPGELPGLNERLRTATREHMGELGWEEIAHAPGYLKRCEKCSSSQTFPWADRLDAGRVVGFMRRNQVFWLGALEKTL